MVNRVDDTHHPLEAGALKRYSRDEIELELLIRARYPLIYVVSWEEKRVMDEIDRIAEKRDKKVYVWTTTNGLVRHHKGIGDAMEGKQNTKDPIKVLGEIRSFEEPVIIVLKDYHPYMKDPTVVRGLRDLAAYSHDTSTAIILLSPTLNLPPELEKDITIVDFPLPGAENLKQLCRIIAKDVKDNPNLRVDLSPESVDRVIEAAMGLTWMEAEGVLAKVLVDTGQLTASEAPLIYSEKRQIIRKTGILEYIDAKEQMSNVGGLGTLKRWLEKRRLAFSQEARQYGLPVPKGVLFVGVQGCGKSLCAKAVSNLWSLPILRLDMGCLFSSFIGSSEQNARRAISVAESVSPVILWIDELDKGFSGIQSSNFSDSGTTARVFGTIITWLQEKEAAVFVIATANEVELLPPELLRKGRFDEIFFVDLPSAEERREILAIHLKKRGRDPAGFDLEKLAAAGEGFSGSEIEQAIISALYDAFEKRKDITTEGIVQAMKDTYPLSVTMREAIEGRRQWAKGRARMAS